MTSPPFLRRVGDRLLVGLNASDESLQALQWAARLAISCQSEIHVAYAWFGHGVLQGMDASTTCPADFEIAIESRLQQLSQDTLQEYFDVTTHALRGRAAHALAMVAQRVDADLMIVGASHRGILSRVKRASVSAALAEAPTRPLAIIPADTGTLPISEWTLVVGADGSASSSRAMQWTAHWAMRCGARVLAVHAFSTPIADPRPHERLTLLEEANHRLEQEWCSPLR